MDAIVSLGVLFVILVVLVRATESIAPGLVGFGKRRVSGVLRSVRHLFWTAPRRAWGAAVTLWLLLGVFAIVATVSSAVMGEMDAAMAVIWVWVIVIAIWCGVRWWAERRFRARSMAHRTRGRRR